MDNQLKQDFSNIDIPTELHDRSKKGVNQAKAEMGGKVKRFIRKNLLAASIMVPTGVFAYQTLLADDLYGSFDNVKKHVASATMNSYLLFDAKLNQAKGDLGQDQFEQLEGIEEAMYEIQPYFDKLNGQISSKEVLTPEEYKEYIQALITYETIMAKSRIAYPSETQEVPKDLQEQLMEIENLLLYVNEKQITN